MDPFVQTLVTIVIAIVGSSGLWTGLWTYLQNRSKNNSAETQLLRGLAHDRIEYLSTKYIERGYITSEEYENLYTYLYIPYHNCGGNGTGDKLMAKVDELPMHDHIGGQS